MSTQLTPLAHLPPPHTHTQNDMLADDLEHYSEQNQKLNKECEAQATEIASLQEQLAAAAAKVCGASNHFQHTPDTKGWHAC